MEAGVDATPLTGQPDVDADANVELVLAFVLLALLWLPPRWKKDVHND